MPAKDLTELCCKVDRFLKDFRNLLDISGYPFSSHYKNEQTMNLLEITNKNRKDILYSLTTENYVNGPKRDKYHKSENIWEFGTRIDKYPIYIKIKIYSDKSGNEKPWCYSFHISEFPLKYQLRNIRC